MAISYEYSYGQDSIYCYPDSSVLRNKLNIQDPSLLEEAERNITALRILEIRTAPPKGQLNFSYLKKLHASIFMDLYDWAGKPRTINIAKGNLFCDSRFIENTAAELFLELQSENYLKSCSSCQLPLRLSYYLSEINAIHPFREGNGRTQRLFIEIMADRIGYNVDFSLVSPEDMIEASAESFLKRYDKMNTIMQRIVAKAD